MVVLKCVNLYFAVAFTELTVLRNGRLRGAEMRRFEFEILTILKRDFLNVNE